MTAASRKVLAFAIIVVLLLGIAKAAEAMNRFSWDQLVHYQTPYAVPLPYGQASEQVARQVIVVVADGLRLDTSQSMPELNKLRRQGADFVSIVGEPSLSLPGWTAIVSGADQEISGVTANSYDGAAKVDSLFAEAKRQRLATAVVGSASWLKLFGNAIDASEPRERPDHYRDMAAAKQVDSLNMDGALSLLRAKQPDLMVIHLQAPDYAGHSFGGASAQYRDAAQSSDALLSLLLREVDLSRTALVFTSSNGHIDRGGNGGGEAVVKRTPLVLAGKGVKQGITAKDVAQVDIAPTVAVLLGTPVPVHSRGRALIEALDGSATLKGQQALAVARELAVFYDAYTGQLGGKPFAQALLASAQPNIAGGEALALADFQQALAGNGQSLRNGRIDGERALRVPLAGLVLILVAVYFWRSRRRYDFKLSLLGAAVYFAVYNLLFFGRGYRWSLSAFNDEGQVLGFFHDRGTDALVAILLAVVVVGILARRHTLWDTASTLVHCSLLIAYLLVVQVAIFFALYGFSFPWYLPDLSLGFKFYLDLQQLYATAWPFNYLPVSLALPFLGIIVRIVAGLVDKYRQPRLRPEIEAS